MIEHIQQLLQLGYTTTVVLYPFKENLTVVEGHIMGLGDKPLRKASFTATCIINNNKLKKKFAKNKDEDHYSDNDTTTWGIKMKEKERENESLVVVDNYMAELYKLHQKGDQRSEKEEKIRIKLIRSFSSAIKKAVERQDSSNYDYFEEKEKQKKTHYMVVIPTEWNDGAANDILRPIFKRAGLITEDDLLCKLIFVDKLHAIMYSFQKHLYDVSNKYWLKYGILKKNKHYVVFEVDFEYYSYEASIKCFFFQTGNTNSMIDGMEVVKPYNVVELEGINLVSIKDMRKGLRKLLNQRNILPSAYSKNRKKTLDLKIEKLLEDMIKITIMYYINSKKNENDQLINEDYQSRSSQMSLQYPFRNLDVSNYVVDFNTDLMKKISMNDLHDIFFRKNEIKIRSYVEKSLTQYSNTTIQGAILVYRNTFKVDSSHLVYPRYDETLNYHNSVDNQYSRRHIIASRGKPGKKNVVIMNPRFYNINENYIFGTISQIISSCTEKYFSSTVTDTVEKMRYFKYNRVALAKDLLLRTKADVEKALNLLPPSVIQYPESNYSSMLKSTEKSCPSHIVNIDLSLHSCKYSYVQINKHIKDGIETDNENKIGDQDFPPLDSFIKLELLDGAHKNAFLQISQNLNKMFKKLIKKSNHLQVVLQFFTKYDSRKCLSRDQQEVYEKFCDETFVEDKNLATNSSLPEFLKNETLLPMIKELFEGYDNTSSEEGLVAIYRPSYIMTFIVIHFIYLQHKIDIHLKENYKSTINEISYVVSVDRILLDECLMGSKSTLKELLLASGLTSKSRICKQLRVITQDECLFPVLQQKANLDLPLKSYYVHAQLYETSIQMSLNQVVVKGNPESTPMTIVVKNDTIPIKHMRKLLFDTLWNQIQSNCHQSLCEEHQVDENGNLGEREYSMADRLEFEKTFMRYVKELSPLKQSIESKRLKIPNNGSFCDCSIYLTHDDIVELSIKPVLKTIVSFILGALTNDQVFGEYYMSALFVTFDSILDSIFHPSYKQILKSILEKTIKIRLKVKQLEIPYFVLLSISDINSSVKTTRNSAFSNLFSNGSLLQVSSATYLLKFRGDNDRAIVNYLEPKIYVKDPKTLQLKRVAKDDTMITILERGDTLVEEEGTTKKKFYIRRLGERSQFGYSKFYVDLYRADAQPSENGTYADVDYLATETNTRLNFAFSFSQFSDDYNNHTNIMYFPLYITIKPLGYQSLISVSFEYGRLFKYGSVTIVNMGDPLTLKSTQYVPQLKKTTS